MKNRHKKEFLTLNLPTVSAGEYAPELSIYTDKDGNQAIVLPGWTVSGLSQENIIWGKDVSLVIYQIPKQKTRSINWQDPKDLDRIKKAYSQFVWIPVKFLDANGTLDGKHFTEKFGRRNYLNQDFSNDGFNENLEGGLLAQSESVSKYGGFYISRYLISKGNKNKPQSVKGAMPWHGIDFYNAQSVAATFIYDDTAKSQLTYGAEKDSLLEWLIKSECKTRKEVIEDSSSWGIHYMTSGSTLAKTGSQEKWRANNVYDVAGNVYKWTQEKNGSAMRVIRGNDCFYFFRPYCLAARRTPNRPDYTDLIGFRVTIYITK